VHHSRPQVSVGYRRRCVYSPIPRWLHRRSGAGDVHCTLGVVAGRGTVRLAARGRFWCGWSLQAPWRYARCFRGPHSRRPKPPERSLTAVSTSLCCIADRSS
jgi:hypothetical protein